MKMRFAPHIPKNKLVHLNVASLAILCATTALGSINVYTFEGTITQGLPGSPYQAGLSYSDSFSVNSTNTSTVASGLYFPTIHYSFEVGTIGVVASSPGSGVLVANDQPLAGGGSFDGIIFSMFGEQSTGFPAGVLFDGSATGITLVNDSTGPTATPFTDTSFPSTLDLNQFSQRYMNMPFQGGDVQGSVDSLYINGKLASQVVPEPGLCGLFTTSGFLLAWRLVRQRRIGKV